MTQLIQTLQRLTPVGRVLSAVAVLVLVLVCGLVLKSCGSEPQTGPNLAVPADTGGYSFPFKDEAQAEDFVAKSKPVTNQCTFSLERYAAMRGLPLNFDVLIPPNASSSPYYFIDVKQNMEYVPAFFISPTTTGMRDALEWASSPGEVADSMPACSQPTAALMMLGFERGQRPINQNLLHVNGLVWFNSFAIRPAEAQSSLSADIFDVPVVAVGSADPVSYSRAADPPQDIAQLNTVVRRGDAVLRVSRMEFTETETRVWMELIGRGARSPGDYPSETVSLRQNGAQTQSATTEHLGDSAELLSDNPALNDLLPADPIPAAGAGTLSGYLVFPPVDRTKTLYLSVPEPGAGSRPPLTITIPSSK